MEYATNLSLDVNAKINRTIINAKQGDSVARLLSISIKKDGENYIPSNYSKIMFRCQKPDGHAVIIESTEEDSGISISGNVVSIPLPTQALVVKGRAYCDIAFIDSDDNILSSASFVMNIVPAPNVFNAIASSNAFKALEEAIKKANSFADNKRQFEFIFDITKGILWDDSDVTGTNYDVNLPSNIGYVNVNKVRGRSKRVNNTISSSKLKRIVSIGKNICDRTVYKSGYFINQSGEEVEDSSSQIVRVSVEPNKTISVTIKTPVPSGETVYLSYSVSAFDEDGNYISTLYYTENELTFVSGMIGGPSTNISTKKIENLATPSKCTEIRIASDISDGYQVEYSATSTAFENYTEIDAIEIDQSIIDNYPLRMNDEYDFVAQKYTSKSILIDLSDLTWVEDEYGVAGSGYWNSSDLSDIIFSYSIPSLVDDVVAELFDTVKENRYYSSSTEPGSMTISNHKVLCYTGSSNVLPSGLALFTRKNPETYNISFDFETLLETVPNGNIRFEQEDSAYRLYSIIKQTLILDFASNFVTNEQLSEAIESLDFVTNEQLSEAISSAIGEAISGQY